MRSILSKMRSIITKKKVNKQKAGPNSQQAGRDINDSHDIYIGPSQPLVMQAPMISEQAKIWFNEQMKAYGCPGDYIPFGQMCAISPKFLEEVAVARNEFIKWAQDNTEDGVHLPPYKERYTKAKELWNEYVKSSPREEA